MSLSLTADTMTADGSMVEIEGLAHAYGDRRALDGINLTVSRGTLFALLGPNGSGKTTLFRILSTLLPPVTGQVRLMGWPVVAARDAIRRRLGVVFQAPSLDRELTVRENLLHQGHLYGLHGAALAARIAELLERFGLADRACDRVKTLSGGLRRRVELAKSLLHRPELLLLDEPSTGLDPRARRELADYLVSLRDQDGVTALLTTHLMDEADRCDRVAILDGGRLVAVDTPAALKQQIGGDIVIIETAQPEALAADIKAKFGIESQVLDGTVRCERERGHAFIAQVAEVFPGRSTGFSVHQPTLEDVFVRLTGHRLEEGA
ncbi:ABC transporter ATP-binding protein [bacterium]|nr:ABC transporter ATP-binding protein [bacterium]